MSSATAERPARAAPPAEPVVWAWRSGACHALEHHFELLIEPASDFVSIFRSLVEPFRASGSSHVDGRYEIRGPSSEPAPYCLTFDGERVAAGRTAADMTGWFAWHVNQTVIKRSVEKYVLLHAAAATRAGLTIILPGEQESGKTTTVAGLLRAGFDYITDEAVALDPVDGTVSPFPKPLSLDPGSWPLFADLRPDWAPPKARQWQVRARDLGCRELRNRMPPPRVMVFPKYLEGEATRRIPLSTSEATVELARATFHFARSPRRNLAVLSRVAREAQSTRLVIGDLGEAVREIESLVSEKLLEAL